MAEFCQDTFNFVLNHPQSSLVEIYAPLGKYEMKEKLDADDEIIFIKYAILFATIGWCLECFSIFAHDESKQHEWEELFSKGVSKELFQKDLKRQLVTVSKLSYINDIA